MQITPKKMFIFVHHTFLPADPATFTVSLRQIFLDKYHRLGVTTQNSPQKACGPEAARPDIVDLSAMNV